MNTEAPVSLRGLYGAPRKRKQAHRTPPEIIAAVCESFQVAQIPLDPCAHRNSAHHFARDNWTSKGLDRPWRAPAYANPQYDQLASWMAYARSEARRTGHPTALLGPWRSHRVDFTQNLKGAIVVFLKAFPFAGMRNGAPFPCFLAFFNVRVPRGLPWELDRKRW